MYLRNSPPNTVMKQTVSRGEHHRKAKVGKNDPPSSLTVCSLPISVNQAGDNHQVHHEDSGFAQAKVTGAGKAELSDPGDNANAPQNGTSPLAKIRKWKAPQTMLTVGWLSQKILPLVQPLCSPGSQAVASRTLQATAQNSDTQLQTQAGHYRSQIHLLARAGQSHSASSVRLGLCRL